VQRCAGAPFTENADLLADQLIWSQEEDPEIITRSVERIAKGSIVAGDRVGVRLWERRHLHEANLVFERLTKICPQSATLWNNLGASYRFIGQTTKAKELFDRALSLDPANNHLDLLLRACLRNAQAS
jgi:Flp pilus assembly protein TadD